MARIESIDLSGIGADAGDDSIVGEIRAFWGRQDEEEKVSMWN